MSFAEGIISNTSNTGKGHEVEAFFAFELPQESPQKASQGVLPMNGGLWPRVGSAHKVLH
jgi:hypothetical protein